MEIHDVDANTVERCHSREEVTGFSRKALLPVFWVYGPRRIPFGV